MVIFTQEILVRQTNKSLARRKKRIQTSSKYYFINKYLH